MAQIQFSTPYIIEGCDVPPRGAAKPLHDEMKMKAMKLIETTANRGNAAGQSLRTGEPDHPLLTRPFRAKPDLIADNLPMKGQVPRVPHLPRGPAASLNISEYHSVTPTNTYLFSKQEDSDQGGSSQIKAGTIFRIGPRHVPGSQLSRPIRAKPNQFVDNFPRSRRGAEPGPVPRASRDFLFLEIGHKKSQIVTESHTICPSVFFPKTLNKPQQISTFLQNGHGMQPQQKRNLSRQPVAPTSRAKASSRRQKLPGEGGSSHIKVNQGEGHLFNNQLAPPRQKGIRNSTTPSLHENPNQGGSSPIKPRTIFRVGPRHVPGSQHIGRQGESSQIKVAAIFSLITTSPQCLN
jgi:hypothetical protein